MALRLRYFYHTVVFSYAIFFTLVDTYEPQLKCYHCYDCGNEYVDSEIDCDPRHFFCVYVKHANKSVDRYCGDAGNCTLYKANTICSMCSADYCNDMYRSKQELHSASLIGIAIICLVAASVFG